MTTLLEPILESPRLPELVDELQLRLAEERARRQKFYEEITADAKAEFINGKVIMHSPAKVRHLKVRDNLHDLLRAFVKARQLGWVTGEKALCVFPRNDYEPDVCFFGREKAALLVPGQLKLPIPDFIAEVLSDSTEIADRGQKFEDYGAHGVPEYWIIDPEAETLEQFLARDGRYYLEVKSGTGEVRSAAVAGFCIPVRALFDEALNLQVARALLSPPPR
jgi:Uma2 family endonuclease